MSEVTYPSVLELFETLKARDAEIAALKQRSNMQELREQMAREFQTRLDECQRLQERYLASIDDPICSVEQAATMWRALSVAVRKLGEDYPVTLLHRIR